MLQLLRAVSILTDRFNQLIANAKKVNELPPQVVLNPDSLLHVMIDGISQSITVQQILESSEGGGVNVSAYPDTKYNYTSSNNFTLPENVQAISVRKNGSPTEVNITDWSQLGNVITYNGVLESGDYLIIGGVYVVPGSGGSGGGGCITAECVESLPTFDNDLDAVSLPNYTPYKTSTGEIRYKLPGTMPTSSEWIDEEEWIDEAEWID